MRCFHRNTGRRTGPRLAGSRHPCRLWCMWKVSSWWQEHIFATNALSCPQHTVQSKQKWCTHSSSKCPRTFDWDFRGILRYTHCQLWWLTMAVRCYHRSTGWCTGPRPADIRLSCRLWCMRTVSSWSQINNFATNALSCPQHIVLINLEKLKETILSKLEGHVTHW